MSYARSKSWYTPSEASATLDQSGYRISAQEINAHIARGTLQATEVGRQRIPAYMIRAEDLERFRAQHASIPAFRRVQGAKDRVLAATG